MVLKPIPRGTPPCRGVAPLVVCDPQQLHAPCVRMRVRVSPPAPDLHGPLDGIWS